MKITSWSPVHGTPGTTSNLLAIALYITVTLRIKSTITQTNFCMNNLEGPLLGNKMPSKDYFQDIGMDALARSIKSAPLDEETFYNASYSLLRDKLFLLPGTTKNNQEFYEMDMEKVINNILKSAERFYDVVYIDTNSGKNNLSQQVVETSDLVIVNLNQNKWVIDRYFKEYKFNQSKVFYLIGNYDRRSMNNIRNLRRQYRSLNSQNSAVIPYCTEFTDAMSNGNLIDFILKNKCAAKDDKNGYFMENVALAAHKILKKAGWKGEVI